MQSIHQNPSPRNEQDIVLYDGDCKFCKASIETLRRLDGKGRLKFISLHEPSVATDYPDLTHEMLMSEMWVVSPEGNKFGGADAVRYLSRRLPALYPLAPLLYLPFMMPLWRACYRTIARYRYRIAGRRCDHGTCHLHQR